MKVALFFPPQWTPTMPYLAVPTLTAYLRGRGVEVQQRDLNVEVYDYLLTLQSVEDAITRLREEYGLQGDRRPPRFRVADRQSVQWALREGPSLARRIEPAKAVLRSQAFYDGPACLEAFLVLDQCLTLISLAHFPTQLEFTTFKPAYPEDRSRDLLAGARDERTNPFLGFFQKHVAPGLAADPPDLIGISIPTMAQMLPGMTLAYLIKQAGIPSHVTVGGPHITMLREQLPQVPRLFTLIDSAVSGEGEIPLLRLAEAVVSNGDLNEVPNLFYKHPLTGEIRKSQPVYMRDKQAGLPAVPEDDAALDSLPDFDGLPLERYFVPDPVLPLTTAHGCYHGKCAFCNVGYGWLRPNFYLQQTAEKVVEQMTALHQKYGARHIFFADEAISPRNLRHISSLIKERGLPLHWCGCTRFEKVLSKDLLEAVAQGGGRMLLFGLETASEPMIEAMDKGTKLEHMGRILREGAEAGIWNHTFFFFGFPRETIENAQETVNFVYAHQSWLHSASVGTFLLEKYSPVYLDPLKFGVKRVIAAPDRDLAIYFDYEVAEGMNEDLAETIVARFMEILPKKRFGQYYMHDTYKLLYAGYLHDQGLPFPPWLVAEQDEKLT
jgi:hypothetical protein